MRALFAHILTGAIAASSFFAVLFLFDTGDLRHFDTLGVMILFGLVAMFFLTTQLILARLSQDDEDQPIRIRSRDRRR